MFFADVVVILLAGLFGYTLHWLLHTSFEYTAWAAFRTVGGATALLTYGAFISQRGDARSTCLGLGVVAFSGAMARWWIYADSKRPTP